MKHIAITFDDGRSDNYSQAKPIMDKYRLKGTVYVTTGFVDGTWEGSDVLKSPTRPLSIEEIADLQRSGWEIGLHGDRHCTEVCDMQAAMGKLQSWGIDNAHWGISIPNSCAEESHIKAIYSNEAGVDSAYIRRGRKCDTHKLYVRVLYGLYSFLKLKWAYRRFNRENVFDLYNAERINIPSVVIRGNDSPEMVIDLIRRAPDNSLIVLMLHSILPADHPMCGKDPWSWEADRFDRLCAVIRGMADKNELNCAPLGELLNRGNSMKKIENKVIVWSIDDFNTLGLMRQLGSADLDLLFLIKGNKGMAASSKYCKAYVETESIEAGCRYLLDHYANQSSKPIIIAAGDDIITYIDQHKDELEGGFILPTTTRKGDIEKYIDKNRMTALAEQLGILCPKSVYITKESSVEGTRYPCIIKPSHQKPGHYNEFKFRICKNERALKRTLRFVRPDSEFILQEYIPKESDLLVYGGRMWDGKTVIAGAYVRDRLADSGSSSHGYIEAELPCGADASKIEKFLEYIDYHGLFSVEYGLLDNKAYFFEVNLRNDGTSDYFRQAGANIPLAYVYSAAGLDYSHIPTKVQGKSLFIDELFDVENVLTGKVSRRQWKQDMEQANVFKYYDKEDMEPYEIARKGRLRQIAQDIILKRFRLYIVFVLDKLGLRK